MFLTNWWKKISESSTQQAGTKKHAARADEWVFYRCALLAFLTIISSPLMAKDSLHNEIFHFNIPRQSADVSLITFAEQANLTLIVPFDEVSVITANRLVGRYPIKEALDILLSGTGLEATVGDSIRITFESNQDTGNKMKNRKSFLAVMFGVIFGAAQVTEAADTPTPGDPAESDTYAENETILEEVLVMGSNIRQSDTETAAPVTYIDRDSLELTSAGSVAEVVLNLAANAGTVLHPVLGANIGSSNFNLRNLGPGSTLVLVNGRRAGKSPLADNLGNQFFDLNQLPLSMIGRIDIQTDGASAIYGSEAVAGVVNITTRKGFEGVEVSYRHEDASNTANIVNFAFGSNSDNGSFALYATSYKASMSYRSDLDFVIERSGGSLLSTSGSPDEYRTLNPLTNALGRTKIIDPHCVEAGGVVSGGHCRYDFFDHTSPLPKDDRLTFFTEFDYDLGELFGFDEVKLFGELGYADNKATRAFGPQTNSNGPYDTNFLIPSSHPFNFIVNGNNGLQYIDPTTAEGAAFWQANPNAAANLTTSGSFRPIGLAIAGKNAKGSSIRKINAIFT